MLLRAIKNTLLSNPMVNKEVLLKFRHKRYFLITSLYALFTFLSIVLFLKLAGSITYRTSDFITWLSDTARIAFIFLTFWQFTMVAIFTLSFTSTSITSEKEQNTLPLLFSSQLSPAMIIVGKFISAILYNLVTIFILLPIFSTIFMLGGISLSEVIYSTILVFLGTSLFSAVAIFWSTVFKKTILSNILSFLSGFAFVLGPVIVPPIILEIMKLKKIYAAGYEELLFFIPQLINPLFPLYLLFEKANILRGAVFKKHGYSTFMFTSCTTIIFIIMLLLFLSSKILKKKYVKN